MLKDGDRCTVARIDHDGRSMVLKRYNFRDPLHTLVHMAMRSRARWSWSNGHRLRELGFTTPRPLAMVEQRIGPLRLRSFLLMEHVEGESLAAAVQRDQHVDARLHELADQAARLWDELGRRRITYGDMKASNFLIDRHGQWWLIDLDGMRFHRSKLRFRRERSRDRDSFMRNWLAMPKAAAAFARAIQSA